MSEIRLVADSIESDLVAYGDCPNCQSSIPLESTECWECRALFDTTSAWHPKPNGKYGKPVTKTMNSSEQKIARATSTLEPPKEIWHYTIKYGWYGAIAAISIKALDTTITMYSIDEITGNIWLAIVASLFVTKKWPWAPVVPLFLSFKFGVKLNLFIVFLSTLLVGALFGFPAGMIVGTVVGHSKNGYSFTKLDPIRVNRKPYVFGIALPFLALSILIPLYFWFHLWLVDYFNR